MATLAPNQSKDEAPAPRVSSEALPEPRASRFNIRARTSAWALDGIMCAMMFAIQRRHRLHASSRDELESYIDECASLTRDAYYLAPAPAELDSGTTEKPRRLHWQSPIRTDSPENNRCYVDLYPCEKGWSAPTVLLLHALMSTSDTGYRQWAADFNERGWNACFIHLPYHYSRTPARRFNGELAITADLVRTAEGLRQGVSELRQLMTLLRGWGCQEFGLWASSYGGWIGALLASVEADFRFVALMEPIVDIEHAIWTSPAGAALRRELRSWGIGQALVERHFHLASPMHAPPLCGGNRVILAAGEYDHVARLREIARLGEVWRAVETLRLPQGHFGYRIMPAVWNWLVRNRILET